MDQLSRLQHWYAAQCDGEWEHAHGIEIVTLDNPGWLLRVDLTDTDLQHKPFTAIHRGNSENDIDWLHCKVDAGQFEAAGGTPNLPEMLETFLTWTGY